MIRIGALLQQNSYSALLQREEWKSFARGFRRSHGNACAYCRRSDVATNAHHICYAPDVKPWEQDPEDLILLCEGCHKEMHHQLNNFRRYVFRHFRPDSLRVLNGALAVGLTEYDPLRFAYAIAELVSMHGTVERFCDAWIEKDGK